MLRLSACTLLLSAAAFGQFPGLSLPPSGDNQRASVMQGIGPVTVTIEYSSPRVKDRRGAIWGKLVPNGLNKVGFGNGKPGPWRAGANENTVFAVTHPVKINGQALPAGRYGLHFIVEKDEWTLILSKNSTSWGSFFYEESEDALRVKLTPKPHAFREWLTYEFTSREPEKATVELQWEELAVAWDVAIERSDEIYISRLREELRTVPGFNWQGFMMAAQYTVQTKKHLDAGLEWAEAALSAPFVGQANFQTFETKAQVLRELGRTAEAKEFQQKALAHPTAGPMQIHGYARQMQANGRAEDALEVFAYNHQKHGDVWPVTAGMMRYWSAKGDYAKALDFAKKALAQAPDPLNKQNLEKAVQLLGAGKPIS